jgi:hypothetical protein
MENTIPLAPTPSTTPYHELHPIEYTIPLTPPPLSAPKLELYTFEYSITLFACRECDIPLAPSIGSATYL